MHALEGDDQVICSAMEDAYVLAEELRAATTVEDALARYVSRRKPRANWVQQQSIALSPGHQ